MFKETSYENIFFTENWPASTSVIKGEFSKKIKSLSNINSCATSHADSLLNTRSNSRSTSLNNLFSTNNVIEAMNKLNLLSSQGSLLDVIEEE